MNTIEPYHDDEAKGVLFEVIVHGRRAQGYISCALLAVLDGSAPSQAVRGAAAPERRAGPPLTEAPGAARPGDGWDTGHEPQHPPGAASGLGAAVPCASPADWVALYRRHQPLIDEVVARRAAAEGWDTVMLRRDDLARVR